jgi:hypothetical protein
VKIAASSSLEDVAFVVCTALSKAGITAVRSGGGAAAIYAPEAKQTDDLDFILDFKIGDQRPNSEILLALDFELIGRGMYRHPLIPFTLDFPDGPLAVGDEVITSWNSLRQEGLILHIVSPTNCVRDRLAAAIHWHDPASAVQAAAVASLHEADLELIRTWCIAEGGFRQFEMFRPLIRT